MKSFSLVSILILCIAAGHGQQTTFQKTYGGTNDDIGNSIIQTNDGGFIITGYTASFGAGNDDIYLLKTDSDGSLQWTRTFGGSTNSDRGNSIQQTNDGGFIITGVDSFFTSKEDVYLIKTNSNGDSTWTKTYGGTRNDHAHSIQQTSDGGFIITGRTNSFGISSGNYDVYLTKTASDGMLQWTKTYGGSGYEDGFFVQQTNDGGYIITGNTYTFGAGNVDVYLVKTASDGSLQWTKTYGGSSVEDGISVQETIDGGFIISGLTISFGNGGYDVYLVKTASDGMLQWTKTYGGTGHDVGYSVQQTNNGEFIISGSYGAVNDDDVYLIKTDSDGTLQWSKTFGGTGDEAGVSLKKTNDGGFIIGGQTNSFGAGDFDVYLLKIDSSGNSGCNEIIPNTQVGSGGIEGTGGVQGTGGTLTQSATKTGSGGIKTTLCTSVEINENNPTDYFVNISPNPFSTRTTVQITSSELRSTSYELEMYDVFGRMVKEFVIRSSPFVIERGNLPSGIYFIQLTEEGKPIAAGKLVIAND